MIYYNFVDSIDTQDNFFNTLAQKGYILKEQKIASYDENGFLDENKTALKLYKDNHPVEFDELPLLFSTIKNFIKTVTSGSKAIFSIIVVLDKVEAYSKTLIDAPKE